MPTVLLVRHGRTSANAGGVLAGWTPGVALDEAGREQAAALGRRLSGVPLTALVSSPLERCQQTAAALLEGQREGTVTAAPGPRRRNRKPPPPRATDVRVDDRLGECRYGAWTGRELKVLAKEPLWRVVQAHPSAVRFPGEDAQGTDGESMRDMQTRAVDAVRDWDAQVAAAGGPDVVWAAVSHGDVIKAIVADALGAHLDQFQRIVVDPCSVTVVRYSELRPFVVRLNDVGGDVSALVPQPAKRPRRRGQAGHLQESDAVVGGGAGAVDGGAR